MLLLIFVITVSFEKIIQSNIFPLFVIFSNFETHFTSLFAFAFVSSPLSAVPYLLSPVPSPLSSFRVRHTQWIWCMRAIGRNHILNKPQVLPSSSFLLSSPPYIFLFSFPHFIYKLLNNGYGQVWLLSPSATYDAINSSLSFSFLYCFFFHCLFTPSATSPYRTTHQFLFSPHSIPRSLGEFINQILADSWSNR